MADTVNTSNIDEIVSGVREDLRTGENLEGGVHLEFVEVDESETVLAFEESVTGEQGEDASSADKTDVLESQNVIDAEKPQSDESSSVPTEKNDDFFSQDKIWTTYVPRFTEVSETYRIRKSTDPEPEISEKKKKEEREPIFASEPSDSEIDPTAELDAEHSIEGATVVTSGNTASDAESEVSTMFKFEKPVEPSAEPLTEQSVIDRIDELLNPDDTKVAQDASAEEQSESVEVVAVEAEDQKEAEETTESELTALAVREESTALSTGSVATSEIESVDEHVEKKKNREFSVLSEKDSFIDAFVDSITSIRVRLLAAAMLSLILLLIENASFLNINLVRILHLDGVGGGMALITFPFIMGIFLLALPEVIYSFAMLSQSKVVPEIFITSSFLVVLFYNISVMAFSPSKDYNLFGFVFAVVVILMMLASYYKKKAEFAAFKIISQIGEKRVIDRKLTRNLPAEHRVLDGMIESYKSRTARVFRTSFVSDFSARNSLISENTKANILILCISFGAAVVGGLIALFIPGGIVSAARTFALIYILALPSFVFISHKIPYFQATSATVAEKSVFIGERALFEYSGIDVITFDDTEIFTKEDVNLQRIMVYGKKENLPKALAQMSALFTVVGGPLAYIFADAVDRRVSPADNVTVYPNGIVGEIDGTQVMAGSAAFMESKGVKIPYDPSGEGTTSKSTRIMYASEGGEVYAKFYVRYMLSEDFTMILPILTDEYIKPVVYTRDPNVDDQLFRSLTAGKNSIRVLKKQNLPSSEVRLYSRVSLGMASVGDKNNIINSILLSKKYAKLHEKLSVLELPVTIAGAVIGLLLSMILKSSISSLILSLWYVGWAVGVLIFSKRMFKKKKEKNKDKNR